MAAKKPVIYTRYPKSAIFIYDGATIAHYTLGALGIVIGYNTGLLAIIFGVLYFVFACLQMWVIMPFAVCPNCVYYRMKDSLCISGLNVVSKKYAKEGNIDEFANRGKGLLCHNNMYMASLFIPIVAMIPALIINYSLSILTIFLVVICLLIFRILVLFPKIACLHCAAKNKCPNAQAMGLGEK